MKANLEGGAGHKAAKKRYLPPAPAFGPISGQTQPFAPAQKAAAKKTAKAQTKLPQRPTPAIPGLKNPTKAQVKLATKLYLRSREHALGGKPSEVGPERTTAYERELHEDPRSRKALEGLLQITARTPEERAQRLENSKRYTVKAGPHLSGLDKLTHKGSKTVMASLQLPNHGDLGNAAEIAAPLVGAARAAGATAVAAYHDPIGVPVKTLKGGVEIIKAAPSGIVNAVLHPEDAAKGAVKDYEHRYGQSFKDMVKRIRKDGAAPEVADAFAGATLGGATLGKAALHLAEKKGLKVATAARPALRTSGGIVKPQELGESLGKVARQRAHDRLRTRKVSRAAKAIDEGKPVDAVLAQALRDGQVVRLRPKKLDRSLAKSIAKTKSRSVLRMKGDQHRIIDRVARKALYKLNQHERRAYYYIGAGLAPAERQGFVDALAKRAESISKARDEDGVQPKGLARRTDELDNIAKIDVSKIDFAKLRATHRDLRTDAIRVGRDDPALNAAQRLQRRYTQQADTLGVHRGELADGSYGEESVPSYIRRVQKAADDAGLERPVYFPSERFSLDLNPDHAARALGGARAKALDGRYQGKNFRLGIQDTTPETYLTGLARNIKRKHNWKLVADLAEQHAIGGLRGNAHFVRSALMERGIDPKSYVLWNPKIWRGQMTAAMKDLHDTESATFETNDIPADGAASHALAKSIDDSDERMAHMGGWVAVPKGAWKEIEDSTKPSGAIGRSWDIFKGKNSRILLGAGNIPWLQFQVASNALLAGFATKGAIGSDVIKAQRWYKGLKEGEQQEIDALLGAGTGHDVHQPHLGSTANDLIPPVSWVVNTSRAFKDLPLWDAKLKGHGPSIRDLNPIEAMFKADHFQNARFKRAVLYNQVKRDAFHRMGEHMSIAHKFQTRIAHALTLGPEDAMKAILHDKHALEHHAETVNDWLGDYTTYTARERKLLSRSVMFYGFMRFSLKFVFYTMPVKHPAETAIVAKLGQLQASEIKDLLGGEGLPWSFGKLYLTHDGKLKEVDLARANPALNTMIDTASTNPAAWTSILPPMAVSLLQQMPAIGGRKYFFNRDFRTGGHSAAYGQKVEDIPAKSRALIVADEFAGMFAPYRIAEKLTQEGPQSDDSTLLHEIPMKYTGKDNRSKAIRRAIEHQKARDRKSESLLGQLVPLLPRPSSDQQIIEDNDMVNQAAPKHKKKAAAHYYGAGVGRKRPSSGGHYYTGAP